MKTSSEPTAPQTSDKNNESKWHMTF